VKKEHKNVNQDSLEVKKEETPHSNDLEQDGSVLDSKYIRTRVKKDLSRKNNKIRGLKRNSEKSKVKRDNKDIISSW